MPRSSPRRDVDLVPLAAAGNTAAFEQLYTTYNDYVRGVAFNAGAGDLMEDVAQTVWVWLLAGRWRLQRDYRQTTLHAFVARLAVFVWWRLQWQDRHPPFVELPVDFGDVDHEPPPVPLPLLDDVTPEQIALRHERRDRLRTALRTLRLPYRRVARLRYLEVLSGPDIAARIGVQPETVPGYLHHIRRHLRRELAAYYCLPPVVPGRRGGGHRLTARLPPHARPRRRRQTACAWCRGPLHARRCTCVYCSWRCRHAARNARIRTALGVPSPELRQCR